MFEAPELTHVLLLANEDHYEETGPELWEVLADVRAFYGATRGSATHERLCITVGEPPALAEVVPPGERLSLGADGMAALLEAAAGSFQSTLETGKVITWAREITARRDIALRSMVVITDQELAPPDGWRYLLWSREHADGVLSIAALDPDYWGIAGAEGWPRIADRARVGCLCLTGWLAGLERCDNPSCFLFRDVASVLQLDRMKELGPEHGDFVVPVTLSADVEAR
ncbi:MAG TPA: hypothetical protein VF529_03750 [Solirubrobacteraceae bacterium]|jgi:hypothetical protein